MRNLVLILCLSAFFSVGMSAQDFLIPDDAYQALKTELEVISTQSNQNLNANKTSTFSNNNHATKIKYQVAQRRGIKILMSIIFDQGSSSSTIEAVMNHEGITMLDMVDDKEAALRTYLTDVITKK